MLLLAGTLQVFRRAVYVYAHVCMQQFCSTTTNMRYFFQKY